MSGTGKRCVTRALWDLQAAATRARAADPTRADAALKCEPTFNRFLCTPNLAPPGDPFTCEILDADPTGTAVMTEVLPVKDDADMDMPKQAMRRPVSLQKFITKMLDEHKLDALMEAYERKGNAQKEGPPKKKSCDSKI